MNQGSSRKNQNHLSVRTSDIDSQTGSTQFDIKYLVRALIKYSASDLHLKPGRPPLYRINGKLIPAKMPELGIDTIKSILLGILTPKQVQELEAKRQVDLSFLVPELGRFRCNIFYQKGSLAGAIRTIPLAIPNLNQLGLPEVLKELCQRQKGLLLVTGATGSGKSTTLAALIQYLNDNQQMHILLIEDPIEFVHRDIRSSITQREVGSDLHSMKDGLIAGLRQDPDVIVLGEIRDAETIQAALTAAETGHLVITTLHTNDAKSSIDRILDVVPAEAKNQIRAQLAYNLVGVVSQHLLLRADGTGMVPACEVMIKSPAIEGYILRNELDKIQEAITNSNHYYKMQSMNQALEKLVTSGAVTLEEAMRASNNPSDLKLRLSGVTHEEGFGS